MIKLISGIIRFRDRWSEGGRLAYDSPRREGVGVWTAQVALGLDLGAPGREFGDRNL